jgi:hypothetical protein
VLGTTSAIGTDPSFTLPAAPVTSYNGSVIGEAQLHDTGTADIVGRPRSTTGSGVTFVSVNSAGTYATDEGVTATAPFTWTTTDYLFASGTYEAAS